MLVDDPLVLFPVLAVTLLFMAEVGFRLAARRNTTDPDRHDSLELTRNQIALLLSLLLGFVLSMALTRFDVRRDLVVQEANAIGTTGLRADMLPPPFGAEASRLVRTYVDARWDFANAAYLHGGLTDAGVQASRRSKGLQQELWRVATMAAEQNATPITALFVESLNQTIDLDAKRMATLENRIPLQVWMMLGMLSVTTTFMVGYSLRKRSIAALVVPPLMVAVVATLTADLDAPHSGLIRLDRQSLERLEHPPAPGS